MKDFSISEHYFIFFFREMGEKEGKAPNRTVLNTGLWLAVQNSCHVKMNVSILIKANEHQNTASSFFPFTSLFIQICTVILQCLPQKYWFPL